MLLTSKTQMAAPNFQQYPLDHQALRHMCLQNQKNHFILKLSYCVLF